MLLPYAVFHVVTRESEVIKFTTGVFVYFFVFVYEIVFFFRTI